MPTPVAERANTFWNDDALAAIPSSATLVSIPRKTFLIGLGMVFLLGVILKGCFDLWTVLALEARGPLNEYALYTIVGRGILNGLAPYADLYESKPPGMFLLAALSLLLTSGDGLARVIQIIFLALIPVALALFGLYSTWRKPMELRVFATPLGFCLGILLALFLEEHSGFLQTELYGSLFACAYAATLVLRMRETTYILIIRSALLLGAIGMKEPFLLVTLAVALLFAEHPRQLIRTYLLPLIIAGITGLLLLLAFGWLQPYTQMYLPSMLGGRMDASAEPVLLRGLLIRRLFVEMTTYGTAPLLGYLLTFLWLGAAFLKTTGKRVHSLMLSACTLATAALAMTVIYMPLAMLSLAPLTSLLSSGLFLGLIAASLCLFGLTVFLLVRIARRDKPLFWHTFLLILALYPLSLAVGLAGYNTYHFAAAFPFYVALALLLLRHLHDRPWKILVTAASAMIVLSVLVYQPNPQHLQNLQNSLAHASAANRELVTQVDTLLDACGFERYHQFGALYALAFTRHSPIGPLPDFNDHVQYLGASHPLVKQTIDRLANDTPVIFIRRDQQPTGADGEVLQAVKKWFTSTPPSCATPHLPIEGYDVLFRAA